MLPPISVSFMHRLYTINQWPRSYTHDCDAIVIHNGILYCVTNTLPGNTCVRNFSTMICRMKRITWPGSPARRPRHFLAFRISKYYCAILRWHCDLFVTDAVSGLHCGRERSRADQICSSG